MRRRDFIAGLGGAAAWPVAARAQRGEQVRRVGVLSYGGDATGEFLTVFRGELQKFGWIEGRNLRLDVRLSDGNLQRVSTNAAELVKLAPDVIVTTFGADLRAAQEETKSIPIVFAGAGDPVEYGMLKNVARPEGNITGFASSFSLLGEKWLQLLKEVAPSLKRVAFLDLRGDRAYLPSVESGARLLEMQLVVLPVSDAVEMKVAIERFAAEPNGGLLATPAVLPIGPFDVIRLAEQYRLPAISGRITYTANGGLMSYESDIGERTQGAAGYVDRILRGAKVNALPVQYPTKFRLVINLKTAKSLGLTIPETLLATADEVIQ
jgi:putative tryptophan/tyrosine transport system substrate-binding protein